MARAYGASFIQSHRCDQASSLIVINHCVRWALPRNDHSHCLECSYKGAESKLASLSMILQKFNQ